MKVDTATPLLSIHTKMSTELKGNTTRIAPNSGQQTQKLKKWCHTNQRNIDTTLYAHDTILHGNTSKYKNHKLIRLQQHIKLTLKN